MIKETKFVVKKSKTVFARDEKMDGEQ